MVIIIQNESSTLRAEKAWFQQFLAIFHRHVGMHLASSVANILKTTPTHRDNNQHQQPNP